MYTIMEANGVTECSCRGFRYKKKCPHLTPTETAKNKRVASKAGKAVHSMLVEIPAYIGPDERIASDPGLAEFINSINNAQTKRGIA